jgi:Tetracyclin repressor-like, C-terminal domain/Alcohol dehydrogenase GroES-like domain
VETRLSDRAALSECVAELDAFGLDHIKIAERPISALDRAQVRVRVRAASLNHRDLLVVQGRLSEPTRLPRVLLSDCAGEVVEVGSAVERFKIGLVADMAHDVELAETFRREVLDARRKSMRAAFARAEARGEVRGNLELELLLDMLTGPFYYRVLFGHAPISRSMASDVVEYVLRIARRD